jgi:hypothetical protein
MADAVAEQVPNVYLERTHVKLLGEVSMRRGKCGGQYKRRLVLPRQRANFSGDAVECLS